MPRLASAADFEQPGGLYWSPDTGEGYRRYQFFAERAALIHARFPTGLVLVAGCGYGFLNDELEKLGRSVYGLEASAFAVGKLAAAGVSATVRQRIQQGSALTRNNVNAVASLAGLGNNGRFAVTVTEDLLPMAATQAEAATMLAELRRRSTALLHVITCSKTDDPPGIRSPLVPLWRTREQWRAIVGAGDIILDAEGHQEVP